FPRVILRAQRASLRDCAIPSRKLRRGQMARQVPAQTLTTCGKRWCRRQGCENWHHTERFRPLVFLQVEVSSPSISLRPSLIGTDCLPTCCRLICLSRGNSTVCSMQISQLLRGNLASQTLTKPVV